MTSQVEAHDRASPSLDKPRQSKKILRLVFEGLTDAAIGDRLGVSQSSITRWRQRHSAEIEAAREAFESEVTDYAISAKVVRIADLDQLRTYAKSELEQNGYAWTEETRHGAKRHISGAALELRATLKQAAEELDQLPRAGITVQNQNVVIVKSVEGGAELE